MIKTGRTVNIKLGHGDSSRFNLLGGSFGEAGDVLVDYQAGGRRFLKTGRRPTTGAGYQSYYAGPNGGSISDPSPPDIGVPIVIR